MLNLALAQTQWVFDVLRQTSEVSPDGYPSNPHRAKIPEQKAPTRRKLPGWGLSRTGCHSLHATCRPGIGGPPA